MHNPVPSDAASHPLDDFGRVHGVSGPSQVQEQRGFQVFRSPVHAKSEHTLLTALHASLPWRRPAGRPAASTLAWRAGMGGKGCSEAGSRRPLPPGARMLTFSQEGVHNPLILPAFPRSGRCAHTQTSYASPPVAAPAGHPTKPLSSGGSVLPPGFLVGEVLSGRHKLGMSKPGP